MRLGNTGVKINPSLLLLALKAKMCSIVVIFLVVTTFRQLYAVVRLILWTFSSCVFQPCTCTLFGRGTGCNEISTGLITSHYSFSSGRNSGGWKEQNLWYVGFSVRLGRAPNAKSSPGIGGEGWAVTLLHICGMWKSAQELSGQNMWRVMPLKYLLDTFPSVSVNGLDGLGISGVRV